MPRSFDGPVLAAARLVLLIAATAWLTLAPALAALAAAAAPASPIPDHRAFLLAAQRASPLPAHPARASTRQQACAGHVYLTLDTGTMRHANLIADILKRRQVQATFFLANENTTAGGAALGAEWDAFWKDRVKEGHAFGSHTFDHVYFSAAASVRSKAAATGTAQHPVPVALVRARPQFGPSTGRTGEWDSAAVCNEIARVDEHFRRITGRPLDRYWRTPGGRGPQEVFDMARSCGWQHVGWTPAGFLGDELPSDAYPNDKLLARSLATIRDGDILMAHLGIRSRRDPYAPTLEALIAGLQARGLCFATMPHHPSFLSGGS